MRLRMRLGGWNHPRGNRSRAVALHPEARVSKTIFYIYRHRCAVLIRIYRVVTDFERLSGPHNTRCGVEKRFGWANSSCLSHRRQTSIKQSIHSLSSSHFADRGETIQDESALMHFIDTLIKSNRRPYRGRLGQDARKYNDDNNEKCQLG